MNRKVVLSFLFGWCLIISTLLFTIRAWALEPLYYHTMYAHMDLAEELHVSQEDLFQSIDVLLDYLKGEKETIQTTIVRQGQRQNAFNTKERRHMIDVRSLYRRAMICACCATFFGVGILLFLRSSRNLLAYITRGILRASFCFMGMLLFLGMWMAIDFTDFWTHFHLLFFDNSDWLLTPGVDFMIDILPEFVFQTLVIGIVVTSAIVLLAVNGFCLYYQIKKAPIGFEDERK